MSEERAPVMVGPGHRFYCPESSITYELAEQVGSGGAATVFKCHEVASRSKEEYACKVLDLGAIADRSLSFRASNFGVEVAVMRKLHHPGIVRLITVVETEEFMYIVMEMVKGGELFYKVVEEGALDEAQARYVFIQLLHTLKYLHSKDIIHRDIKPENILIKTELSGGYYIVQIADFGLAKIISSDLTRARTFVGTPQYWAPEVVRARWTGEAYGIQADLWSLGIVLFVILGGTYPFPDRDGMLERRIMAGNYSFEYSRFKQVSNAAKDLITCLLTVDTTRRLNIEGCFRHPWINEPMPPNAPPLPFLEARDVNGESPVPVHAGVVLKHFLSEFNSPVLAEKQPNEVEVASCPEAPIMPARGLTAKAIAAAEESMSPATDKGPNCAAAAKIFNLQDILRLEFAVFQRVNLALLAFRHHPTAAKLLRKLLSRTTKLHYETSNVVNRFHTTATAVLGLLPDLQLAIEEGSSDLAIDLLDVLRDWVSLVQDSINNMHDQCASFAKDLSEVVDTARAVKDAVNSHLNAVANAVASNTKASPAPSVAMKIIRPDPRLHRRVEEVIEDVSGSFGSSPSNRTASEFSDVPSRVSEFPDGIGSPNTNLPTEPQQHHMELYRLFRERLLREVKNAVTDLMLVVETNSSSESPGLSPPDLTASGSSMEDIKQQPEKCTGMCLLPLADGRAPTTDVVTKELIDFLLMSPRCRNFACGLLDATNYDCGHADTGWWPHEKSSGLDLKKGPVKGMSSASSSWQEEQRGLLETQRISTDTPTPSPTARKGRKPFNYATFGGDGPSCDCDDFFSYLAGLPPDEAAKIFQENVEVSQLLVKAMSEIRQVDKIIYRCDAFWNNMTTTVEQLGLMKDHVKRLVAHSLKKEAFKERFFRRIADYRLFWATLQQLCENYSKVAERKWQVYQLFAERLQATAEQIDTYVAASGGASGPHLDVSALIR